ncbi:MAG: iron-sulfur cluster assembly scaffold protein [Nanoarchaeota archaeon]|nr:iron-sulfur cluster assembly scaffold protein [Nanoarchaeota archaeon]
MSITYSKKTMEHFLNPKNMGEIKNADGVGKVGNKICGDIMWIYIKVGEKKIGGRKEEMIKDIKFKTLGCAAAIATSSMITELAKGKTFSEALKITRDDVKDALGNLPPVKLHCSNLAADGLREAICDYLGKSGKPAPKERGH